MEGGACWAVGVVLERAGRGGAESRTGAAGVRPPEGECREGWGSAWALTQARCGPGWAEAAVEEGDSEQ